MHILTAANIKRRSRYTSRCCIHIIPTYLYIPTNVGIQGISAGVECRWRVVEVSSTISQGSHAEEVWSVRL